MSSGPVPSEQFDVGVPVSGEMWCFVLQRLPNGVDRLQSLGSCARPAFLPAGSVAVAADCPVARDAFEMCGAPRVMDAAVVGARHGRLGGVDLYLWECVGH